VKCASFFIDQVPFLLSLPVVSQGCESRSPPGEDRKRSPTRGKHSAHVIHVPYGAAMGDVEPDAFATDRGIDTSGPRYVRAG
jgi:hypothetical protein